MSKLGKREESAVFGPHPEVFSGVVKVIFATPTEGWAEKAWKVYAMEIGLLEEDQVALVPVHWPKCESTPLAGATEERVSVLCTPRSQTTAASAGEEYHASSPTTTR